MTAQYLRLRDTHPTMIKLEKLNQVADELGLSFSFYQNSCRLSDKDLPDVDIRICDLESNDGPSWFPFEIEYKCLVDNPVYLQECKERAEADAILRAEKQAEKERLENEKKEKSERERMARERQQEIAQLLKLKEKYPDI